MPSQAYWYWPFSINSGITRLAVFIGTANPMPELAELMDLPRDTRGTLVIDVTRDGPAEAAGLLGSDRSEQVEGLDLRLGGDIIIAIDGTQVRTIDDLIAYLVDNTRPEDESVLEVIREDGSRETIQVTLDQRPSP